MPQARFIHGAKLFEGDDLVGEAGMEYTQIKLVTSVGLPFGFDVDDVESTSQDSADFTREFVPGLVTRQDCPIQIRFDPHDVAHRDLVDAAEARTLRAFKVELPLIDSTNSTPFSVEWNGYLKLPSVPNIGLGEILNLEGTVKVASTLTITVEAA